MAVTGSLAYQARAQGRAQAPASGQPSGPVYVVTFVDITPNNREAGVEICKQYVAEARKAPGVTSATLLAQANRTNHLVLYEVFQNQAAFDQHAAMPHTKDFRAKMAPLIGSPFDQRAHFVVQ
jgi:quinol monooxygenase YgiN